MICCTCGVPADPPNVMEAYKLDWVHVHKTCPKQENTQ